MADIKLTAGNDTYVQDPTATANWNNLHGEAGNDSFGLYNGSALGGPGDDRIERLVHPTEWWNQPNAAYWTSPAAIRADLNTGIVEDGWGGRDTLVNINNVAGSNHNDTMIGNAADNRFWSNGGVDTIDGGAGIDTLDGLWYESVPGQPWLPATLSDLRLEVSVDGLSATIGPRSGRGQGAVVTNVEYLMVFTGLDANGNHRWEPFLIADAIEPAQMAQQAVASGGDLRWNAGQALGSSATLSYSFVMQAPASGPGAAGFRAFTAAEQQAVRTLLASVEAFTGLRFVEVNEAGGTPGQMRFGVSQQAATRGVSWQPNQAGAGEQAGDIWMDVESMLALAPGTEGYAALLHEIGHALGLRHPRATESGEQYAANLRAQDDRTALSVMSQTSSADGLFRADWGLLDVQALRYLYGSRAVHAGDDVYRLGAAASGAQTTLVDDGGIDTIDASELAAGVSIDLAAAHLSSVGVTAAGTNAVENLGLAIGTQIEHAVGSRFDDVLSGNALDNRLTGHLGNDWIDGGAGTDTAVFAGRRADYEVSTGFGKTFVRDRLGDGGFDTLVGIERLEFADRTIALSASALGADASLAVDEDGGLTAALPDPSDVARTAVSYRIAGAAAHGSASISADGQLRYTPQADFHGVDSVAYEIVAAGSSNLYLAYVDVLPVNDAGPVGRNSDFLAIAQVLKQSQLPAATDIDGDVLSYSLGADAAHGEVVVGEQGSFSYRPAAGYAGSDSFTYVISDGMGGSATYTARLTVAAVSGTIEGTAGDDTLAAGATGQGYSGGAGNDRITGGGDNDVIDGGAGLDVASFTGKRSEYTLTSQPGQWTVKDKKSARDGVDLVTDVERLRFSDLHVALDLDGAAGSAAQILRALIGPQYLQNETYAGIALGLFDGGMSYEAVIGVALSVVPQFAGGSSNEAFVQHVYRNVIGTAPAPATLAEFTAVLDSGAMSRAALALLACQIDYNTQSADLVGLASTGLEYLPG
ncbi:tandem-95 repeat protein [Aquabacterium humicola]|uniref:tandem-95 repeat protein n=1 Tax=Aquabacterium humicola TaxID=3237377 RepID=UPI00254341E9|nr:tandem-95 repeat protein [Rubrivivax pictus]